MSWKNTTGVTHTATDDGGLWDTLFVNTGQTATISFSTPGTYTYHCSIHADMLGRVVVNSIYTAASTQQYGLAGSDGSTWKDLDAARLALTITPKADALAVINANADLWTGNAGFNQDLGIAISGGAFPTAAGQPEAWKESGGFAGTFSPNAAFVQTVVALSAGTAYMMKLEWKTNKVATGATIYAGAGPIGTQFSPTRLTAQLLPSPSTSLVTAVSTQQYNFPNSDGATWSNLDTAHLGLAFTPAVSGMAILGANADLWTANAGFNQDLGINLNNAIVGWKESGGFAGTFSPNAAFVQAVAPMTGGTSYTATLQWKTNKAASGASIHAGAGPIGGRFSPTRLTLLFIPSGTGLTDRVSPQQYKLVSSNGSTWQDLDGANLSTSVTPATDSLAIVGGNADLWTANSGYNQDLGIAIAGGAYPATQGQPEAWKESGGFAGTFSPNAAFVQTVVALTHGVTYTIKLQWKTNKAANSTTIYSGAGPIAGQFSPTRLDVLLVPA